MNSVQIRLLIWESIKTFMYLKASKVLERQMLGKGYFHNNIFPSSLIPCSTFTSRTVTFFFNNFNKIFRKICYSFLTSDWNFSLNPMWVFWMLTSKPTLSLSSFTFIKRIFSFSSLSAIRVVSSTYLRLSEGQEEKGRTEDEMAGWHHWLNGCEFEWTLGVGDGQRGLACCDSWGSQRVEHDWATELNWTEASHPYVLRWVGFFECSF